MGLFRQHIKTLLFMFLWDGSNILIPKIMNYYIEEQKLYANNPPKKLLLKNVILIIEYFNRQC